MRVRVSPSGLYTYPDAIILCGAPQFADDCRDTVLNPAVIIEVLSPSTEAYDRGRKFEQYQQIDSLRQYLLLAQDHMRADLYTRQSAGGWLLLSFTQAEDFIGLESVGCKLSLAECYEKVEFGA
jgi:Uma2 family endonuclease